MNKTEEIHVCQCGAHGLAVSRIDWNDDGVQVDVQLAMWTLGEHGDCTCWRCRWRHIRYILKHGHPYPDDWVSLTREQARDLAEKIVEAAQ